MPQYLDTGSDNAAHYLGNWLDNNLTAGVQGFRAQFGYFSHQAMGEYAATLSAAATAGHAVHIVLGSNSGSLTSGDLQSVLQIISGNPHASLTVVSYQNAEFHPKTLHIVRQDGSAVAVVGSSNFTGRGLGLNVEASLVLDSSRGDDLGVIQEVAEAIDRWRSLSSPDVHPIRSASDVQTLVAAGLLDLPQPPRPSAQIGPQSTGAMRQANARRTARWRPRSSSRSIITTAVPAAQAPAVAPVAPLRWCKKLEASDAQQVSGRTNPTGKLRLTKSKFPIDRDTWFRYDLFRNAAWRTETRLGKNYEVVAVDFDVHLPSGPLGSLNISVDYALHRIAGQANVPTVLAWGVTLGHHLSTTSYVGHWVIVERDANGRFSLTIQAQRPAWAP